MIVVDASIVGSMVADDEELGDRVRSELSGARLYAPDLVDLEVTSSLRRRCRHGELDSRRAVEALSDLMSMRLARISHTMLLSRIWDLRDNLSAYDASYVALAQVLGAPLWTGDAPLSRAPGLGCEVVLVS